MQKSALCTALAVCVTVRMLHDGDPAVCIKGSCHGTKSQGKAACVLQGVLLTHRAVIATVAAQIDYTALVGPSMGGGFSTDDVMLSYLPLAHIFDRCAERHPLHPLWRRPAQALACVCPALCSVVIGTPAARRCAPGASTACIASSFAYSWYRAARSGSSARSDAASEMCT